MKRKKSTKQLTLTVFNPLTKEKEEKLIAALSKYLQELYYA